MVVLPDGRYHLSTRDHAAGGRDDSGQRTPAKGRAGPGPCLVCPGTREGNSAPAPAASAAPVAGGVSANYEDVAVTPMRKVISTRLTESKQSIPHYYVNQTCDVDELLKVGLGAFDDG